MVTTGEPDGWGHAIQSDGLHSGLKFLGAVSGFAVKRSKR
jgi:hypothetical protein